MRAETVVVEVMTMALIDGRPGVRATDGDLELTDEEAVELVRLFAADLARGWIPTEADLRAGLAIVRSRSGDAVQPPAAPQ